MRNNPLVSIVLPVYNAEKYLNRCVHSIVKQSYLNWELLLIDDGSSDLSPSICDKWAIIDRRIKVFHKKNGGVSSARNMGLESAHGEWLMFVDSDDWLSSDCINTCVECVLNDNLDFLQFNYYEVDDHNKTRVPKNTITEICTLDEYVKDEFHRVQKTVWSSFIKRSLVEDNQVRFNERMQYGEDGVFICSALFYATRIRHIPAVLYYYYQNSSSAMHAYNFESSYQSLVEHLRILDNQIVFQRLYRNLVTSFVSGWCNFSLKKKDRKSLRSLWLQYRDNSPYVHIDEYSGSAIMSRVFIPLQKYSFDFAWLCSALAASIYRSVKK